MTTDQIHREPPAPALPEIPDWLCVCIMAAFVLLMLGKVLFLSPQEVLSDGRMDLAHFFVHWRYFGFHEMKSGNLPLWNPHFYCGAPFFGDFQSALLYPLNFLYLLAPLDAAINWTIALHVFLGGVFTFYWAKNRALHSLACLLAAVMFMFCGPHFLQIHAGHLPNLCTLIWAPLLFLAIDQLMDRPALGPMLTGMFAMAMAILAGHPQYVFYMGVAAGIYSILNLTRVQPRGKILLALAAIVLGGVCLSAVQLFTGLDESRESMRSLGMSYEFASLFSFPPENLLTLAAPWLFGDAKNIAYVGRWFVTDVSLFVGVMGLALAIFGMSPATRPARRFSVTMAIITLVLAMGEYTPVFRLLFDFVPGFNLFRGTDKFLWLTALFLSMLAGTGFDRLLRGAPMPWWPVGMVGSAGIVVGGLAILPAQLNWWAAVLVKFHSSTMVLMPLSEYIGPNILERSSTQAVQSLILGGISLIIAASLFALARRHRKPACAGMLLMTAIELACFAQTSLTTFQIDPAYSPAMSQFLAAHPGDYRIQSENPNSAMTAGTLDIGGDDPSGLLRYLRYLDYTGGIDFDAAPYAGRPAKLNGWALRMLRCRFAFWGDSSSDWGMIKDSLPRLLFVNRYRVMTNFHEILPALTANTFHAENEAILESEPSPVPVSAPPGEKGTIQLLQSSTDDLTIEADTQTPGLLLMTDAYSRGWRAEPLPGSAQSQYQILPADYCLEAIPLSAGHHLIHVEYSPLGFRVGKIISIIAWPLFLALAGLSIISARQNVQ